MSDVSHRFDVTRRDVLKGMGAAAVVLALPAAASGRAAAPASATRDTLDLAGMWEFGTDGSTFPYSVAVPNFLVPVNWWIYTPDDFPEEVERVASYGYDAASLTQGWYRHVVEVPAAWAGQRVELQFDGIAMYSEISVNGTLLESTWGMWRTHRLDITDHVQPGQPATISVFVEMDQHTDRYSHGEFAGLSRYVTSKALGIWESVRLVATDPILVDDVFFKPRLDGADIDVTIANTSTSAAVLSVRNVATAVDGGAMLFDHVDQITLGAGATEVITASVSGVAPSLWSPDDPKLYRITTTVERDGVVLDDLTTRVGFRTFEVRGSSLYLNGKPYWMRGAGHLPTIMVGRDKIPQMQQWLGLLRDDNVRVTRIHVGPAASPWYELTDELGMGVDVEGIRPWAFDGAPAPAQIYVDAWHDELIDVIKRLRNHPSILWWATGNEMGPYNLPSWTLLSDLTKAIRAADPTRPLVADSYYVRDPTYYQSTLQPAGIDDGDLDDAHLYFGWYQPSAFVLSSEQTNGGPQSDPNRPYISTELGTGYPDFRTGRPEDAYLNVVHSAQPWVGAHAADADPTIFLNTHALLNKELAEMLRRTRFEGRGTSGFLLFSTATWFKDFYSGPITPFPVNDAVRLAYLPLLVSLGSTTRHFYAGERFQTQAVLVNDGADQCATRLFWKIVDANGHQLAGAGSIRLPAVAYHANVSADITIAIPATLAAPRVGAVLQLTVKDGATTVSQNQYDIVLATHAYAAAGTAGGATTVWLYDPTGATQPSLDTVGLDYTVVTSLAGLAVGNPDLLVLGQNAVDDTVLAANLHDYADAGGRVLILEGGSRTSELFPDDVTDVQTVDGEVVTPVHDDAAAFADMDPMDMRWWRHDNGSKPYVTHAATQFDPMKAINIARLGIYTAPAPPQPTPTFDQRSGYPIFLKKTRPDSNGYLAVSDLTTSTSASVDPLAGKLLANLLNLPASTPLDPPPPTWDGFTESFENGLGAWTVDKGTLVVSTAKAHTGTYSLGKNTAGQGVLYRQAIATHGTVTLWFYDDATATNTIFVTRVDDGAEIGHFRGIGVRTDIDATHYLMRVDATFSATPVVRTTGWHQFGWDYTSGTGVTLSIDGQPIGTATGLALFSTIALGDWWGIQSQSGINFVDDITVTVTP